MNVNASTSLEHAIARDVDAVPALVAPAHAAYLLKLNPPNKPSMEAYDPWLAKASRNAVQEWNRTGAS